MTGDAVGHVAMSPLAVGQVIGFATGLVTMANQFRRDDPAHLLDEGTAAGEAAAGRRIDWTRRIAAQRRRRDALVRIHGKARCQEPLRVRMGRAAEYG